MIMRIGTAFPALWMENELKNHLIRIAIEEDCELDLADYRGDMKKLWNAFPDLDLAFFDYALLREYKEILSGFFRRNPDCMSVAVGKPYEEICGFLELRPAGHLGKTDSYDQIRRLSLRCMKEMQEDFGVLQIHTRQGEYAVSVRNILYCQSDLKYVQLVTKKGTVYRKLWKLDEVLSVLPEYFIRVHQSYVVNVREAEGFDRSAHELLMTDGIRIPVSRPYVQSVLMLFVGKSAGSEADSEKESAWGRT